MAWAQFAMAGCVDEGVGGWFAGESVICGSVAGGMRGNGAREFEVGCCGCLRGLSGWWV